MKLTGRGKNIPRPEQGARDQEEENKYNVDWESIFNDLKNYKEDLPVYTIKEGEFVVL